MELLLKVGSGDSETSYQDGDVVCAFNESSYYVVMLK